MSYGVKYTCTHKTFTNQTETTYRIDILKNGYSGSSTEVLGTGDIFNLEYEKIDATKPLSTPLQNSRLEFNLLVRDASDQAILTEIFDNDERTFKMQLYQNGSLFWDGYVLNDLLEYGQGDYPQEGRIVAKDITALKSFTYPLEDERRTVIHQIGVLLDPLNIGTGLKTVTSWTHDEMSSTNTFLAQTYLDTIAFRQFRPLTDTGANNDGQITYYEALEQLARSFGLVIRQSFGEWHIVQISELRGSTSRVCTFDFAGSQNTNAVQDITDSIDSDTTYILPQSQNTFNPGLKEARYTFNHRTLERDIVFPSAVGLEESEVESENETPKTFSQQIISESTQGDVRTGRGSVTPTIRFRSTVDISFLRFLDGTTEQNAGRIASVNIANNTYAMIAIKIETASKTYYLNTDRNWVTNESRIIQRVFNSFPQGIRGGSTGGRSGATPYIVRNYFADIDIESEPIPTDADGELKVELYLSRMDVPTEFGFLSTNDAQERGYLGQDVYATTTTFKSIEFDVDKPAELANSESVTFNILNDGSNLSAVYEHGSVIFGDGPESFSPSALRYSTQEADFTSGGWDSPGGSGTYSQTLLREILFIQASARRNLSAELYGEYKPNRVLSFESLRFFFLGGSLNGNNVWSADFLEISYESPSASFDELAEGGGTAFSGASSGDLQTFREAVKANQFFNTIFLSNFIGELSSPISASSTITSFTANLSAQIRVGEDFVLVDKANERPFFVSVVADPNTGAEEYNTGENRVVHVEEQFIKNELPVGSPVILAGGLLESYFTVDPTKLSISVDSMTDATALGRVDHTSRVAGGTFDFIKLSNSLVSADNPVQVKDDEQLVLRSRGGQVQTLVVRGDQTYTSSPFQLQVDSFTHAFDVGTASYTTGGVVEVLNVGSSVARIDIKADENEASITSLTSITTNNGLTSSTNITQRANQTDATVVLKTDFNGNVGAFEMNSNADGSTISINADQITVAGQTTFLSALEGELDIPEDAVVIVSATEPSTRDDGSPLQAGDVWKNTSDNDLLYTYDGTDWIRSFTQIDGGDIVTGTVTANKIDVDDLFAQNISIPSGGSIASTIYSSGSSGFQINADGSAEFNDVTVRSANFSSNNAGFELDGNNVQVNGDLTVGAGAGGAIRLNETNGDEFLSIRKSSNLGIINTNNDNLTLQATSSIGGSTSQLVILFNDADSINGEHILRGSSNVTNYRTNIRGDLFVLDDITYGGSISQSSDENFKENVVPLGASLDKITQLEAKVYDMTDGVEREIGLFAQDVEPLFPEAVGERTEENKEGEEITYKTLSYIQLIPALIESIKELKQEIDQLKNEQGI